MKKIIKISTFLIVFLMFSTAFSCAVQNEPFECADCPTYSNRLADVSQFAGEYRFFHQWMPVYRNRDYLSVADEMTIRFFENGTVQRVRWFDPQPGDPFQVITIDRQGQYIIENDRVKIAWEGSHAGHYLVFHIYDVENKLRAYRYCYAGFVNNIVTYKYEGTFNDGFNIFREYLFISNFIPEQTRAMYLHFDAQGNGLIRYYANGVNMSDELYIFGEVLTHDEGYTFEYNLYRASQIRLRLSYRTIKQSFETTGTINIINWYLGFYFECEDGLLRTVHPSAEENTRILSSIHEIFLSGNNQITRMVSSWSGIMGAVGYSGNHNVAIRFYRTSWH